VSARGEPGEVAAHELIEMPRMQLPDPVEARREGRGETATPGP
jgi:hypothetical protein